MPRIEFETNDFFKLFAKSPGNAGRDEAQRVTGVEFVGSGNESVVIANPTRLNEVIAVPLGTLSPREAKIQFYLQRAMSTLFPNNFPHFSFARGGYGVFSGNPEKKVLAGTVRTRVEELNSKPIYPFRETVVPPCRQMGIPIERADIDSFNLMVGSDGGEYYVDNLGMLSYSMKEVDPENEYWKIGRITSHMQRGGYSLSDQYVVTSSIQRAFLLSNAPRSGAMSDSEAIRRASM
ncbi:MAG: hypothetical protein KBD51_03900 [Candidatus Levybacteria bacterium]|nr:hypothetical protein [Candidatus Levybacteria bacterium]